MGQIMGQCCAREGQEEQMQTIMPQPRDRQFSTIRMPMSPSNALREKQQQDFLIQQQKVQGAQPYSSNINMNKHRSVYGRGVTPQIFEPIIPGGGETSLHRASPMDAKPAGRPENHLHLDPNNHASPQTWGPKNLTRTPMGPPTTSLQTSGAGQWDARLGGESRAAVGLGRGRGVGPGSDHSSDSPARDGGDAAAMKPRPSFVPPLPLKEKGIEGQYGPG